MNVKHIWLRPSIIHRFSRAHQVVYFGGLFVQPRSFVNARIKVLRFLWTFAFTSESSGFQYSRCFAEFVVDFLNFFSLIKKQMLAFICLFVCVCVFQSCMHLLSGGQHKTAICSLHTPTQAEWGCVSRVLVYMVVCYGDQGGGDAIN